MNIRDKELWLHQHGDFDLDAEFEDGPCTVIFYPTYYKYAMDPYAHRCFGRSHADTAEELYNSVKERLFELCNGP